MCDVAVEGVVDDAGGGGEEVEQAATGQHVLGQRYRADLVDDHRRLTAHTADPLPELLRIAHRRREAGESHLGRKIEDRLLPDRSALTVREIMHLVHHHMGEPVEQRGSGVQHAAEDLGRHDDDGCMRVERDVAGEKADLALTESLDEIVVLLIAQRLDGRGVETRAARRGIGSRGRGVAYLQGEVGGEFAHDGLSCPRRRAHEHVPVVFECATGPDLEVVESESEFGRELRQP